MALSAAGLASGLAGADSAAGLASGLAGADSSALAVDSVGVATLAPEAFSFDTSGAFPTGAGSVAFSSTVADGSTPDLSTDGTSALGLAVSSDAGVSVLGLVASADAGASVLGLAASAGAGVSVLGLAASAGTGVSVLGLVASADAGASVLGAGRSVSAELAEKAVPASADGTSLSSLEPARLLVVPEVPPPDVSAYRAGDYIARSGQGTL